MLKKVFRFIGYTIGALVLLCLGLYIYLLVVATVEPPTPTDLSILNQQRQQVDSGMFRLNNSWLRKSESGLYEMYVEGEPFERGVTIGKLTRELAQYQEKVFVNNLYQIVPSKTKINFLKYLVGWFNRNIDENIPEEFKLEIYGISTESSHDYDYIAPGYQRILNYHSAHDIAHALQNVSLVGCTSFALWGSKTHDGNLLIGRNFDFFVGDEFAKNKIIAFYKPVDGHAFMMVTFGGMAGALSGMNVHGLTVTINAAKSEIPTSSAMPVTLVAREILQYAATIDEALAIAKKREVFVSESFLIGSATDRRAAVIEKTPEVTELFEGRKDHIICTNHFQGAKLGNTELNAKHMRTSASVYRWNRVDELLSKSERLDPKGAANILRDRNGVDGALIGLGNEKAINQLIAHHSVIFLPVEKKACVSAPPWQLGKYVCYDLQKIFEKPIERNEEIYETKMLIEPDSFQFTTAYHSFLKFAKYRMPFQTKVGLQPDSIVAWNPNSYVAFMLAGDAAFNMGDYQAAKHYYAIGLEKEVATNEEKIYLSTQVEKCIRKIK